MRVFARNFRTPLGIGAVAVVLLAAVSVAAWLKTWWNGRLERSQDARIQIAAGRYGVAPELVKAVVWRESNFNSAARGRAGEVGLMQLREDAAREWADTERIETFDHEHCIDPMTNLLAGTFYLRKLLVRFASTDDARPYALAAYNAGRSNVLKWNNGEASSNSVVFVEQITFPSTKSYVEAVMKRSSQYQRSFRQKREGPNLSQ